MTTPICPRLLNMINDFVLLRFRARTPEDLSAIEVIYLLLLLLNTNICYDMFGRQKYFVSKPFVDYGNCYSRRRPYIPGMVNEDVHYNYLFRIRWNVCLTTYYNVSHTYL